MFKCWILRYYHLPYYRREQSLNKLLTALTVLPILPLLYYDCISFLLCDL